MEHLKNGVFVLWVGSSAAMFFAEGSVALAGMVTFWGTIIAHVGEFIWKYPLFQRVGGDMSRHFIQTLIYGLFYWKPIEDSLGRR
jgi:hypothetical protein